MTDRELLEKAAKAAGLDVEFLDANTADWLVCNDHAKAHDQWLICNSLDEEGDVIGWWNPLKDDGDALRLAVKLKIPLQFPDEQDVARTWGVKDEARPIDVFALDHNGDLGKAVRRAITIAAAAIGESGHE